jgi:hypothetical protein
MTPSLANLPGPAIHGRSFGRFDEITDFVENASALTLACVAASLRQISENPEQAKGQARNAE